MFRIYLRSAFRNLFKNRSSAIINLTGLIIAFTGCLLIGLFVWDEKQYDRFHTDGDRTYRIYTDRTDEQGLSSIALTSPQFATVLEKEFPEVGNTMRMMNIYENQLMESGNKQFYQGKGLYTDADF